MHPKFLTEAALLLGKTLVVADLHLGIEREFAEKGIRIPSQAENFANRLNALIKQMCAKQVLLLGDIKHNVPGVSWQEIRDVPAFLEKISKFAKLKLVKGNHDGDIEKIAKNVVDASGFRIKNIAFAHGHAWPDKDLLKAEYLVLAHIHPCFEFRMHGYKISERCWLLCPVDNKKLEKKYKTKSNLKKAIIMPAFNSMLGGIAVNSKEFEPIGPLLKNKIIDIQNSEVFLLDGVLLGVLKNL